MAETLHQENLLIKFSQLLRDEAVISVNNVMATQSVADSLNPILVNEVNNANVSIIVEVQDKNVNNI
jgi:hypothetical protein